MPPQKPNPINKYLLPGLSSFFAAFLLFELFLSLFLRFPHWTLIHPSFAFYARHFYEEFDKSHIQYDRECARYDRELFYTLRPGSCFIKEREFEHRYAINSMGLRDDELSLEAPEVILLGDSFTMGWGVRQDETFPSLLERKTGLKTLNAGIASYGTAREMTLLSKLDRSKLKYLVIQYEDNDLAENSSFIEKQHRLVVSTQEEYEAIQRMLETRRPYYLGKYSLTAFRIWAREIHRRFLNWTNPAIPLPDSPTAEQAFLDILSHFGFLGLDQVKIIFLNLETDLRPIPGFLEALRQTIEEGSYPSFIRNMQILDTQNILDREKHYYLLDDHMNPEGHRIISEAIAEVIQREEQNLAQAGSI